MQLVLTPDLILKAYSHGLFPMAYSGDTPYVQWVCPEERGILPIAGFHLSRSLKRALRKPDYTIRINTDFRGVIEACAAPGPKRPETWINRPILETFCRLHEIGHAHSVELYRGERLIGGVYGLQIGAAFFAESMFSRETNASKIALAHLAARLWTGGFELLDVQFVNDHLRQFGVQGISHEDYIARLVPALEKTADFTLDDQDARKIMQNFITMQNTCTPDKKA